MSSAEDKEDRTETARSEEEEMMSEKAPSSRSVTSSEEAPSFRTSSLLTFQQVNNMGRKTVEKSEDNPDDSVHSGSATSTTQQPSEPATPQRKSTLSFRSLDNSRHRFQKNKHNLNALLDGRSTSCTTLTEDEDAIAEDESSWRMGDARHDEDSDIGRFRNACGRFVNRPVCQLISMLLIITNAIILGALTFLYDNPDATRILEAVDLVLLCMFTVELLVQLVYLGRAFLHDKWLLFDFFVITFSWIFLNSAISILRSFRIIRVFTLVAKWPSMRRLVLAVGRTIPKMATIWVALLIFFYTFCVLYTDLYHGLYEEGYLDYDYFGRLDYTFLTLFQFMTLDSWTAVVRQVMEARPAAWVGFVCWVIVTSFFVLNLMVAVICDSLIELNRLRETSRHNKMLKQQRSLINNQTEQLLSETQAVAKLQREILKSQLAMHEILLDVATHLAHPGATSPEGKAIQPETGELESGGKQSLRAMLGSLVEDEKAHED